MTRDSLRFPRDLVIPNRADTFSTLSPGQGTTLDERTLPIWQLREELAQTSSSLTSSKALRWSHPGHRYEIVTAILIRGNDKAKYWLWRVLSRRQVRELVRKYRGAGLAEPVRERLRRELQLSKKDIPSRPYVGFGTGSG